MRVVSIYQGARREGRTDHCALRRVRYTVGKRESPIPARAFVTDNIPM